ncbi:MAG: hypothetical protein JW861_08805 [Bacteroidales bacterium]|nr:hypothetical protein [Bacteroidales bacterium]
MAYLGVQRFFVKLPFEDNHTLMGDEHLKYLHAETYTGQDFRLFEVSGPGTVRDFLEFPAKLYRNDSHYIRPLDRDVEAVFDPSRNRKLKQGNAIRWILRSGDNQTIGRVAAFFDRTQTRAFEQPTGGLGFFDCIDNQNAADILFNACRDWLLEHGMQAMDGPVNFGERNNFWGCLVDGFREPVFNMPYNYPYYPELFSRYGFQNYFNQYTYHRKINREGLSPVVREKALRIFSNPNYRFEMINWDHTERFAHDFHIIFNKAWGHFPGVPKMSTKHALAMLLELKPVIDTRLVFFAYYQDQPVSFFVMIPDLNQVIRDFGGKFHLLNRIRLYIRLKIRKCSTRIVGLIFGTVPEHQGRGMEAGLVMAFEKQVFLPGFHYTDLELSWIGDFNPSMMKLCEQIGARIHKTHVTFRYLFDREKPFARARVLV